MDRFETVDEIFNHLKAKTYGQVTDKQIEEALQDMKQVIVDAPDNISYLNKYVSQFLEELKKDRWDKVREYAPQTKQKIEEMKKWYSQKVIFFQYRGTTIS